MSKLFFIVSSFFLLNSCVTTMMESAAGLDQRWVAIQTLSVFNQRIPSRLAKKHWKGDWIFRRERLELVDNGLQNIKPDILILQEVMSKKESPSESDRNIFLAGALADYDWHFRIVKEYEDTQEVESMAVAVGAPLRIDRSKTLSHRELWDIGEAGYFTTVSIAADKLPITIFNVQMPVSEENRDLWYLFLKDRISEKIKEEHLCFKRIVIAGYLPGSEDSLRYQEFLSALDLVDSSAGFCEVESKCYTSTPLNEIFMATIGDEHPARSDRLLVHKSANIRLSSPNFTNAKSNPRAKDYGLQKMWPTQRYGWSTSVKFATCDDGELANPLPDASL